VIIDYKFISNIQKTNGNNSMIVEKGALQIHLIYKTKCQLDTDEEVRRV
jgi:hypothetical protein